jgi:hypothetical protein
VPIPDHLEKTSPPAPGLPFLITARAQHIIIFRSISAFAAAPHRRSQSVRERESNRGLAVVAAAVASFIVRMGTNFYYQIKTHSNSSPNLLCSSFFKTIKCIAHLIHAKL